MARINEDRLLDCILNEMFAAVGCATLAAVPSGLLAYAVGVHSWVGVLLGGLFSYAMLTGVDVYGRARRAAEQERELAELRSRLPQPAHEIVLPDGAPRTARLHVVRAG